MFFIVWEDRVEWRKVLLVKKWKKQHKSYSLKYFITVQVTSLWITVLITLKFFVENTFSFRSSLCAIMFSYKQKYTKQRHIQTKTQCNVIVLKTISIKPLMGGFRTRDWWLGNWRIFYFGSLKTRHQYGQTLDIDSKISRPTCLLA